VLFLSVSGASASITPRDYANVGVSVPENASIPLDVRVADEGGKLLPLRDLMNHPTVMMFSDYTCQTLCGPVIAFTVGALEKSGLRVEDQFRVLVIGLDSKDNTADAEKMRHEQLGDSALNAITTFVTADETAVRRLTASVGYRYAYDRETDQFVHPAAVFVLRSDGRVSRVLTGLGISPEDLRLALVEAGRGKIGTFTDQIRLLCSSFDPAHGIYNVMVARVLMAVGAVTIVLLGGLIVTLALMGRRRPA
jgi:protein SCO1/2